MLHLCNVLNVVKIALDRYRTGHTREQDGEESVCKPDDNRL